MSNGTQELNRYNLAEPQSEQNAAPNTIASAETIAPIHKFTIVTGTTQVKYITPPMPGFHVLYLLFSDANPGTMLTTGNINNAIVPTSAVPCIMFYNPITAKYYGCANNVT